MIWPDADEDRETHQVLVMTYQSWLGKSGKSSIFYHCISGKSWKSTICGCFPIRKVGDLWVFLSSFPVEVQFHCRNLCSAIPRLNSYEAGHLQIVWMCGLWSTDVYSLQIYVWQTGSRKQLIWLVVWIFPFSWECHHPNCYSLIFFRGVVVNHQPVVAEGHRLVTILPRIRASSCHDCGHWDMSSRSTVGVTTPLRLY